MFDIEVPFLDLGNEIINPAQISVALDQLPRFSINHKPWDSNFYSPDVYFSIAYTEGNMLIKFYVHENVIRGANYKANSSVHEDSCVEFFIAFEEEAAYYNLEINCIGTCLFGYGPGKHERETINEFIIRKINRHIEIHHTDLEGKCQVSWELTAIIPADVFIFHQLENFTGKKCRVNFFKCGDKLPEPHFLSWKNIKSPSPNFHLPGFFGSMCFT